MDGKRSPASTPPPPPGRASWFDAADTAGVGSELDLTLVDLAGKEFAACAPPGYLSINIGPATFTSPAALRAIVSIPADDLVVEITEQAPILDYQHATMQRGAFEAQGVRIAVDDAGAGFASTRHILELDPDIIKLDMSITQRVDHSLTFRTAAVGLLSLARAGNAQLVAEGVETPTQLAVLRDLGVEYAQGLPTWETRASSLSHYYRRLPVGTGLAPRHGVTPTAVA